MDDELIWYLQEIEKRFAKNETRNYKFVRIEEPDENTQNAQGNNSNHRLFNRRDNKRSAAQRA